MSKAMAVTLPIILIILDFYPLNRIHIKSALTSHRKVLIEKIPFLGLSFISSVVTIISNQLGGATPLSLFQHFGDRILVAFRALIFYLYKILWPTDLAPFYPYPLEISFYSLVYFGAIIAVICITIICICLWKRQKVFSIAWTYYVVALMPVLGIIQSGEQAAANRYMYLPCLAPFLLIGLGTSWIVNKFTDKINDSFHKTIAFIITLILVISTLLSYLTINQTRIWENSITLWNNELKIYPNSVALAYFNRGETYIEDSNNYLKAIEDYKKAIEINPNYSEAYNSLGVAYKSQGLIDEALQHYHIAIKLDPNFAEAYNNLGIVYKSQGLIDKALQHYHIAVNLDPNFAEAYNNLGNVYLSQNLHEKAIIQFQNAIKLKPDSSSAHYNLGRAYQFQGLTNMAFEYYENAIKLEPISIARTL
jgi:Tfp pilus assembly protein PilF